MVCFVPRKWRHHRWPHYCNKWFFGNKTAALAGVFLRKRLFTWRPRKRLFSRAHLKNGDEHFIHKILIIFWMQLILVTWVMPPKRRGDCGSAVQKRPAAPLPDAVWAKKNSSTPIASDTTTRFRPSFIITKVFTHRYFTNLWLAHVPCVTGSAFPTRFMTASFLPSDWLRQMCL